jgi:hypothetical protein
MRHAQAEKNVSYCAHKLGRNKTIIPIMGQLLDIPIRDHRDLKTNLQSLT